MANHRTGTRKEWLAAQAQLLEAEKELTRRGDEVARKRRELPWVRIDAEYRFETENGTRTLQELFDGHSQLVVYHFMFGPSYTSGCPACSSTADSFNGVIPHLAARDVTMVCISRAPLEKLLAFRKRMGWSFNWASSFESTFNRDFGVAADEETPNPAASPLVANEIAARPLASDPQFKDGFGVPSQFARVSGTDLDGYLSDGHGVSVFALEGETVYHCYSSYARGTEFLMGFYAILDRTPKGRDEGEDAMVWVRRHDEYENR